MSQSQSIQPQLLVQQHRNQRLFSDYYLDHKLPEQWHNLREDAASLMVQLQHIYATFTPNPNNEAQTEDDWIKPVLHLLGHAFEVQAPLKVPDSVQKPDYIFYVDEAARITNKGKLLTEEHLKHGAAFAVGDAKQWERSLDRASKGSDAFTNKNPAYQIFFYMLHSGLPWGILTNGRYWRLYHESTAHKLETYYEVDLPALLTNETADEDPVRNFLYFYTFFRRAAFEPGPLSLDYILNASAEFARGVSESLRQQVYDALRSVAQAFLDYPANNLTPTPQTCQNIYDSSLTLLYRLLFILYAEARDLLPLRTNKRYRDTYSLQSIKKDIVMSLQEALLPTTGLVWARLQALFRFIDSGSPPLNVTIFDGGLFDPQQHPFLENSVLGDASLCRAIDKLARVNLQFVDYRDLAERHLGTIYEGLLEYTLQIATEPMVELKSSSKIVPKQGVAKKDIVTEFRTGEVYLVTDRGERKITGSYYTPDYIVKYMVEQTLRPMLDAAVAQCQTDAERIEAVLAINVLDPSMGSGHFPVEVTEYIARYLVELGVQPEGTNEADLPYWKHRVVQQCIYGVDLNPLAVELAKLSLWLVTVAKDRPLNFLDHHLRTGNALLGSWLQEVAAGQHPRTKPTHKRAKQVETPSQEPTQRSMLDDAQFYHSTSSALAAMAAIEHNTAVTVQDVKNQEAAYEQLRQQFTEKYLSLANLGAALYYNVDVAKNVWYTLADHALDKVVDPTLVPQYESWLDASRTIAETKRFFHWELEFPSIFFDHDGQPLGERAGFDVVIGNPPYVRQEQLGPDKPYFQENYDVYHSVADIFVYFFAQGLRLLRPGGKLAYISSNTWLRANYATPLRQHLRTQTTVETIVDLGNTRVFADAPDLSPAIQVVRKTPPTDEHTAQVAVFARGEQVKAFRDQLADRLFPISIHDQLDTGWQLKHAASRELFTKIMAVGKPLGEAIDGHLYYGVKTGLNDAFIIDQATRDRLVREDPQCTTLIKLLLRGEDLRPWYQENEGRWLICLPNGWTKQTFPEAVLSEVQAWEKFKSHYSALATHLEPCAEAARKRQDKGQFWWELRPCDYYDAFEQPKIFFPDIARFPRFSWDNQGQFVNNKGYILLQKDKLQQDTSLLGILQSRICWFCITRLCAPLGERMGLMIYQHFTQYIERLPIPTLTDEQHDHTGKLAQQLTETAQQRYNVHCKTTYRIQHDLGTSSAKLNQRLELWWQLSFKEFREELAKVFKRDIPLNNRDDWEELLQERSTLIRRLTNEIIHLETQLNQAVYAVFKLNNEEIALIEQETKYTYGEW